MKDVFGKQVGPFKVQTWLLIIAGGIALGVIANRVIGSRSNVGAGDSETPADPVMTTANPGSGTTYTGTGYILQPAQPTSTAPEIDSNAEWINAAVRYLTGQQAGSAYTLQQVLQAYTEGAHLTAAQQGIVDQAISALGPPPDGAPVAAPDIPANTTPTNVELSPSQQFVRSVYQGFLGRDPDPSGLQYWSARIDLGVSQDDVKAQIIAQYKTEQDRAWVTSRYVAVAGRAPDGAGLAYWVNQLVTRPRESVQPDLDRTLRAQGG